MQNRSTFTKPVSIGQAKNSNSTHSAQPVPQPPAQYQRDELTRVFNTAIVSTQTKQKRDFSSELYELTESASFKAILNAVRQLSRVQGVSDRQASEQIIHTFRKIDDIWGGYVSHEGLEKLRCPDPKK